MTREKPLVTNKVTFLTLPNDLLLNCLARVSRLYYPTLCLVSKSFRSLVASTELYETRTLLGCTESCLYAFIWFLADSNQDRYRWFTLCRRPIRIKNPKPNHRLFSSCFKPFSSPKNLTRKKENKLNENVLVSIPTRKTPFVGSSDLITVGHQIYKIGCGVSSKVWFMDCRSHTWHEAPSMQIVRGLNAVNVLDGKIYVAGGNKDCDSSNWIEFFDPETQVWEYVQSPVVEEIYESTLLKSFSTEGKLYLFGNNADNLLTYEPKDNRWDDLGFMEISLRLGWYMESACVVGNIIYIFGLLNKLQWYDFEGGSWRVVKGLKKLLKFARSYHRVRLAGYGGNIAVFWEKEVGTEKEIWCAEISLERRSGQEVHGEIVWSNAVP